MRLKFIRNQEDFVVFAVIVWALAMTLGTALR